MNAKSKGRKNIISADENLSGTQLTHTRTQNQKHSHSHTAAKYCQNCQKMHFSHLPIFQAEKRPNHTQFVTFRFDPRSLSFWQVTITSVYIHYARHEVLEKSIPYKDVAVFSTPLVGPWGGGSVGAAVERTWKVLGFFFFCFYAFSTFYTFGCCYTIFALGVANSVLGAFAENYPVSSCIELVFSTRTESRWNEKTNTDHTRSLCYG